MLRTPEMWECNRVIAGLCSRFWPMVSEVIGVY